jgi:hypothetical protein
LKIEKTISISAAATTIPMTSQLVADSVSGVSVSGAGAVVGAAVVGAGARRLTAEIVAAAVGDAGRALSEVYLIRGVEVDHVLAIIPRRDIQVAVAVHVPQGNRAGIIGAEPYLNACQSLFWLRSMPTTAHPRKLQLGDTVAVFVCRPDAGAVKADAHRHIAHSKGVARLATSIPAQQRNLARIVPQPWRSLFTLRPRWPLRPCIPLNSLRPRWPLRPCIPLNSLRSGWPVFTMPSRAGNWTLTTWLPGLRSCGLSRTN